MATPTNGYVTLSTLRTHLGYRETETDRDVELVAAIDAASRQLDGYCGWRFWQDATVQAREFYPSEPVACDFCDPTSPPADGISTTTGLVVKVDYDGDGVFETTLTSGTDFLLMPRNAATRTPVWPYTSMTLITSSTNYFPRPTYDRPSVQITAKWGWPAIPDDIAMACKIQAAELSEAKNAVFGAIALNDTTARSIAATLHPLAAALAAPYRIPSVG